MTIIKESLDYNAVMAEMNQINEWFTTRRAELLARPDCESYKAFLYKEYARLERKLREHGFQRTAKGWVHVTKKGT